MKWWIRIDAEFETERLQLSCVEFVTYIHTYACNLCIHTYFHTHCGKDPLPTELQSVCANDKVDRSNISSVS